MGINVCPCCQQAMANPLYNKRIAEGQSIVLGATEKVVKRNVYAAPVIAWKHVVRINGVQVPAILLEPNVWGVEWGHPSVPHGALPITEVFANGAAH